MSLRLKRGFKALIRLAKKVPIIRKGAKAIKSKIVQRIDYERSLQEVYNVASFYPNIHEYSAQLMDPPRKSDPLISILLPTYNTPEEYLRECIDSIRDQSYKNWELCIADDKSSDPNVLRVIEEYIKLDKRIRLIKRKHNGMISEATNSALEIAKGEFVALMDHDDILWPNALYEVIRVLREKPETDYIYSDEDKIDGTGMIHSYPFLKPDLNIEFLESCNYMTHFSCIRNTILREIGGFRKVTDGAQDWDLFIRIIEKTKNVYHIRKMLYSWRVHEASTAADTDAKPYVYAAQERLLNDYIARGKYPGVVKRGIIKQHRVIVYDAPTDVAVRVVIHGTSVSTTTALIKSMSKYRAGVPFTILYAGEEDLKHGFEVAMATYLPHVQYDVDITGKSGYALVADSEFEYTIFAEDIVRFLTQDWAMLFISDIQRDNVGCVAPVILAEDGKTILSAGLGIGYGDKEGYLDMLQGMPIQDGHYTRGLYAKSRRNITAANPSIFATKRGAAAPLKSLAPIDWMLGMYGKDRVIYTPYIQVAVSRLPIYKYETKLSDGYEDPMLNPSFRKDSPRMEVRA